jgi:hypothetical protein
MLIISNYDESSLTEKAWFESSNIVYSEYVEKTDRNEGDLYVTFKNGATYKYKNVQITPDYVMFKHGGLDGSHGKALNTHIKSKYEFERVDDKDLSKLESEKEKLIENKKKDMDKHIENTYFISGHRNISNEEFEKYKNALSEIIDKNPEALFVVGDYYGVDIMAQNYLIDELNINPERITVYHMFNSARNINPKITNTIGGFMTDEERDAAMTANSFKDIAFVKNHTEWSGTGQNILRRFLL